jgi:hypothetical protein
MPTETYEMLQLSMVMKPQVIAVYLNGLNNLKTSVRIFRTIQEAGVLQPLEMQTQLQMSMEWWYEIVDWLSDWCRMN